jgi:hypothetical protein
VICLTCLLVVVVGVECGLVDVDVVVGSSAVSPGDFCVDGGVGL